MSEARAEAIKATGFMGNTPEFDRFIKALDAYVNVVTTAVRDTAFTDAAGWFKELGYDWTASELRRIAAQGLPYDPDKAHPDNRPRT
jgi:hypothetical protein